MPAKVSVLVVGVGALVPLGFACGGDDGGGPTFVRADASIDAMEPCKGAESYMPTFAAEDQEATNYPATGSGDEATLHEIFFIAPLDGDEPGDYLYIDLYEGYGAFAGGDITIGSFAITGDDTRYSSCGACIMIGADVTADGDVDDWYVAGSGVLNLSNVTDRFTGSLQNVTLHRFTTDANGNASDTPTFDCTTQLPSLSFDTPMLAPEP